MVTYLVVDDFKLPSIEGIVEEVLNDLREHDDTLWLESPEGLLYELVDALAQYPLSITYTPGINDGGSIEIHLSTIGKAEVVGRMPIHHYREAGTSID